MEPNQKAPDDLEAVRTITTALAPFKKDDQERIIRWAREKVGLSLPPVETATVDTAPAAAVPPTVASQHHPAASHPSNNIKQFVEMKAPKSDMHFAAVVAYYHRFNAPVAERKNTVTAEDLQDACRKADRERLTRPGQTLINAYHAGLLDREDRGQFGINSVGENLVAMALPEPSNGNNRPKKKASKTKPQAAKPRQKR